MARQPLADLLSLKGRRALISGSATGIGEAIALRLAEAGADLVLVDIDAEGLARVAEEVRQSGGNVEVHQANLALKEEIDRLWDALDPVPDILVNNAGIYPFKGFLDVDEAFYRRVLGVNLDAVYWMCQHMVRRRKGGGVIINVGSIEGVVSFNEGLVHYSMSKAGVAALTRGLAKEYGKAGFRINAILPGGVITTGTLQVAKNAFKRLDFKIFQRGIHFKQRLPLGRYGQPDEVARMVVVLASDLAAYVHGAAVAVDGGFLAV